MYQMCADCWQGLLPIADFVYTVCGKRNRTVVEGGALELTSKDAESKVTVEKCSDFCKEPMTQGNWWEITALSTRTGPNIKAEIPPSLPHAAKRERPKALRSTLREDFTV